MIFVKLIGGTFLLAVLGYLWFEATGLPLGGVVMTVVWLGMVVLVIRRHDARHG